MTSTTTIEVGWLVLLLVFAVGGYWLWDRRRYTGAGGPRDVFQPTDERFVDPATGRPVRVYVDPRTGRRQYREEKVGASSGAGGSRP